MKRTDAIAQVRQINAQLRLRLPGEWQIELDLRQKQLTQLGEAFSPEPFKLEFEQRFASGRETQEISHGRVHSQKYAFRRAAPHVVLKTRTEPSEWLEQVDRICDYFSEMRLSMSYTQKILWMMNLRGYFICRKIGKPFIQLPYPRGYYFEKVTHLHKSLHHLLVIG